MCQVKVRPVSRCTAVYFCIEILWRKNAFWATLDFFVAAVPLVATGGQGKHAAMLAVPLSSGDNTRGRFPPGRRLPATWFRCGGPGRGGPAPGTGPSRPAPSGAACRCPAPPSPTCQEAGRGPGRACPRSGPSEPSGTCRKTKPESLGHSDTFIASSNKKKQNLN